MTSNNKIVCVSSIFRDLVAVSAKFPQHGETIMGSDFFMGFGGKGANQCVMAAKLGAQTVIVGSVGDDEHGRAYSDNLASLKVDTRHLATVAGVSTGIATIFVESGSGENMIVIVPGANARLTAAHVTAAEADIAAAGCVVATLELGLAAVTAAMQLGRKHGVTTILNAAPGRADLGPELLDSVDILVVNETEAALLAGAGEVVRCGEVLRARVRHVVITLGKDGALLWEEARDRVKVDLEPLDKKLVVDTTGAGDAFVGSLAFFLSSHPGLGLAEAVARSCRVASLSVMKAGTQASYPDRAQVLHILNTD